MTKGYKYKLSVESDSESASACHCLNKDTFFITDGGYSYARSDVLGSSSIDPIHFAALAKAFAGNEFRPNPRGRGLNLGRATPYAIF